MNQSLHQRGFTLLELMTVVMMVAILATIALPSYAEYMRRAAQSDAQSLMLSMSEDLERYRGKNLTYRGYTTEDGLSSDSRIIYVPKGSTISNYKYKIELVDGAARSVALSNTTVGQGWFMVAIPNLSHKTIKTSDYMILTSAGLRCRTTSTLSTTSTNCGSLGQGW